MVTDWNKNRSKQCKDNWGVGGGVMQREKRRKEGLTQANIDLENVTLSSYSTYRVCLHETMSP